ncbi:23S rRNA (adenine1618-N6)-methyltransferase [Wenyingzhuangia heitensis]|uniref:23S rRNA (Adenine1618-N6)-methyltransferase n=1 Tax=Wenyingzhuangia heitensis TaxID=1487859 RepID=A0ABX0U710_9FLAO|nr:23S rRNA (adenine(1618)-N(6))-methyltransferase RlmF [Wenyingzhuangia heitensis]NIJ44647.1 23S rRNA (adenine1618-N6)-methyltransferase [Wenyingzhuangia heitensis]
MHQKNPFQEDYNFDELCQANPNLKKHVFVNEYGNKTLKFADKTAVRELNKALLKHHYQLTFWDIPETNLCPPIPGRLDYLLHVADLLEPQEEITLLDIGTGANLIYPILGTCHFNWKCTASEVDKDSISNAKNIIQNNSLLNSIDVRHQQFKNSILNNIIQPNDFFDVVVCNPPFFKNSFDADQKNKRKVKNLQLEEAETLNFGGKSNELWYKGGEEAFVKKMAEESVLFKTQVGWFTSLVSQKENLKNIKRAINKTKPTEVKIVDMQQGNKQSRFVAWRF